MPGISSRGADEAVDGAAAALGRVVAWRLRRLAIAEQRLVLRGLAGGAVAAGGRVELHARLRLLGLVGLQLADAAARVEVRDGVGVLLDVHGGLSRGAQRGRDAATGFIGNPCSLDSGCATPRCWC